MVDDPQSLNILVTQLAQSRNVMDNVYDTLTYLDASDPTFAIKGRLASGWVFTEPTKLDFTLREGVTFHGGETFTADDVKWTIEYVKNPETASPNASILAHRHGRGARSADRQVQSHRPVARASGRSLHHPDRNRPRPIRFFPNRMEPVPSSGRSGYRAITSRLQKTPTTG